MNSLKIAITDTNGFPSVTFFLSTNCPFMRSHYKMNLWEQVMESTLLQFPHIVFCKEGGNLLRKQMFKNEAGGNCW